MKIIKNIVQMNAVLFKGDGISNIMRALDTVHKEEGWNSSLIVDLFSEYDDVYVFAFYDYDKTPTFVRISYLISRFIRLDNKWKWLQEYAKARIRYKAGRTKQLIENADIRIWHYGIFYP